MSIEKVCRWFAAAKLLQTGEVASTSACTHDQYSMLHSIESGPCTTWSKICQMTIVCSSLWQTSLRIPSWVYFIPYFFLERLHLFWSNKCQKIDNNMPVSTFEIVQQQLHTILFKIQIEHWIIQVKPASFVCYTSDSWVPLSVLESSGGQTYKIVTRFFLPPMNRHQNPFPLLVHVAKTFSRYNLFELSPALQRCLVPQGQQIQAQSDSIPAPHLHQPWECGMSGKILIFMLITILRLPLH